MKDSDLDKLLRSTGNEIPLPTSFRRSVWTRIEIASARHTGFAFRFESVLAPLPRPFAAVTAIVAMALLGLGLGASTASQSENSKEAYVQSVSPFASGHQ